MKQRMNPRDQRKRQRDEAPSGPSQTQLLAILISIVLGALAGYYVPGFADAISFIGRLFVSALRILIVPLILAAVVVGAAALGDVRKMSRSVGKALLYFVGTAVAGVLLGGVLAYLLKPGTYAASPSAGIATAPPAMEGYPLTELLSRILPGDLLAATSLEQYLGFVVFAIFFGVAIAASGQRGKVVVDFFQAVLEAVKRLIRMLVWVSPLGIFSLVASAFAGGAVSLGSSVTSLGMLSLTLVIGLLLHGLVLLPILLKSLGRRPFLSYLENTVPALATALATASPAASLPVTYECTAEQNRVSNRACSLVLPLGSMINMNGTAIYLVIAALFCAQMFGIDLSLVQVLMMLGAALLVSLLASLIPNVSLLLLATVMFWADFPQAAFAGIGVILAVDWLYDRVRAAVNVWGDAVGAAVIGETFDFKTARSTPAERPGLARFPKPPSRRTGERRTGADRQPPRRHGGTRKEQPDQRAGKSREKPATRRQQSRGGRKRGESSGRERRGSAPSASRPAEDKKMTGPPIPPPPFHVLEQELRPRKDKPDEPVTTSEPDTEASSTGTEITSPEAGATQPIENEPREKVTPQAERSPADAESRDEPAPVEAPTVAYGRGKTRRFVPTKSDSEEKKPDEKKVDHDQPEFPSENISFGRSRRKK
ncbi:MAG: cation:dicarboxylase symporter family transporter [Candidatus Zixiibacteriota bacterium]|nr:MAG: cation:dicarboxylase symporter family transporter [candidate division Zixibacteria bacterium]